MSNYFLTYHNVKFDPINYTKDDILLEDIIHHLCNIPRYGGALGFDKFYSVAQHCIELSDYLFMLTDNEDLARLALLHDASEAYFGDMVSSVKKQCVDYQLMENRLQTTIYSKFIPNWRELALEASTGALAKTLKWYDSVIILDEITALAPNKKACFQEALPFGEELGITIEPETNKEFVKQSFIDRCAILGIK